MPLRHPRLPTVASVRGGTFRGEVAASEARQGGQGAGRDRSGRPCVASGSIAIRPSMQRRLATLLLAGCSLLLPACRTCERCLAPRRITGGIRADPDLVALTREEPVARGRPRKVIDGIGWVVGIPSKIVLWDRRVENHRIGPETEAAIREYLADRGLDHVKVRLNQYSPLADWRRLRANRTVGWPLRYTIGTLSVASEALFPGRLLGGDHYNPWTNTIHLYSDVPSIALHEGGHARDFARRDWPGLYAVAFGLPITELYPEAIATGEALAYLEVETPSAGRLPDEHAATAGDEPRLAEARRILYPAYGTYVGGAAGQFVGLTIGLPVYAGAVVAGHATGRAANRFDHDASEGGPGADDDAPTRSDGAPSMLSDR